MSVDGSLRVSTERQFASHDGVELFYRHWAAVAPRSDPPRAIILLHRGHEHGARMQDIVDKLELTDSDCFAWDARGHGHSPGERGYASDFGVLVRDVNVPCLSFVELVEHDRHTP